MGKCNLSYFLGRKPQCDNLQIVGTKSTSKMRFTNNRLTGLQTDKTWLGLSRLSRVQQNFK